MRSAGQTYAWGDNSYGQTTAPLAATNIVALAAGDYHCLALRRDGTVVAWGSSTSGQTNAPPDATNIVSIASGSTHSLGLRREGTIAQWGRIIFSGVTNVPVTATNIVALALGPGAQHALALRGDGTVVDWGNSNYGLTNIPPTAAGVVSVAAGAHFGLALRSDGKVVSWGENGQNTVPVSATNIVAIAAGWFSCAALRADGTLLVWGAASTPPSSTGFTNLVDVVCPFGNGNNGALLGLRRDGTLAYTFSSPPTYARTNIAAVGAGGVNGLAAVAVGAPFFPGLPINRTVVVGSTAYFRMPAIGSLPLAYQWTCNGTNIPGATNPVLTVTNVQPGLSGSYYALTVSNAFGTPTGEPMTLNVTPLEIVVQPQQLSVLAGTNVTITATLTGLGPFGYQWQRNSADVDGATNNVLILTNVSPSQSGNYSVMGSNQFGIATSGGANLSVLPLLFAKQPTNQIAPAGTNVIFSVSPSGQGPFFYQWQCDGTNIQGAIDNPLVLTNVQFNQQCQYSVVVSNIFGTGTSSNASLTVIPLAIASQPQNQLGFVGLGVTFGVAPVFQGPFYYQWQLNGTNIDGATDNPLVLTNLQFNQAGLYSVMVSNELGPVKSMAAVLDVRQVAAWGDNTYGQTNVPLDLTNAIAIAGSFHSLALRNDGTVAAWGFNNHGQTLVPADLNNAIAIAAGDSHSIALKADGTIRVWGDYYNGLNYGPAVPPQGLTNVVAVAAGWMHALALRADGTVAAWGYNYYGQTNVPTGLTNVVAIVGGGYFSLALKSDGTVVIWGEQPGWGEANLPLNLTNVVAIAAGVHHGLALKADNTLVAWGNNSGGQTNIPPDLTNVVSISGGGDYSLALKDNGTVVVFGHNPTSLPPNLTSSAELVAGANHCLALPGRPTLSASFANPRWSSNHFSVSLPTQSGKVYCLEYKTSLSDSNWTALPLVAGVGRDLLLTDSNSTNDLQRFYRVRRW